MIIYKVWKTGKLRNRNFKKWEGWFLFGLIPLYIKQTHYQE